MYPVGACGKGSSHGRTHALADNTGVVPDRVHPGDGASEAPVSTWPSHRSIWNGRIGKRNSRILADIWRPARRLPKADLHLYDFDGDSADRSEMV